MCPSACVFVALFSLCVSLSLSRSSFTPFPPPVERPVAAPHGHSGRPPELCSASASARRTGGRRHQRLFDGAARRRPLWSLQGRQAHRGQEGQPQRQGAGNN